MTKFLGDLLASFLMVMALLIIISGIILGVSYVVFKLGILAVLIFAGVSVFIALWVNAYEFLQKEDENNGKV